MDALGGIATDAVLDVGCGTGALLDIVLATRPGVRALGIDLSPEMIEVARERLGDRADLRVADAEALPFPDGRVDLVVCVDSFHHYPHPAAALAEMRRVTRPGGALVLGDWYVGRLLRGLMNWLLPRMPSGDVRIYAPAELRALAAEAGYQVERCETAGVRAQLLVARRPR
jgi:ubiquinone/menaquinone biosynthesis C-methylase UbiE